jgi:hypothetical protein
MANFVQPGHYAGGAFVADQFRAQDIVATNGTSAETHITDSGIHVTSTEKALLTNAGTANGAATLDGNGQLAASQIPSSITGGLNYQTTFDPTTGKDSGGTAIPTASAANKGFYWIASVGGSYTPPGNSEAIQFDVGDWLVSNGTSYNEVDNTTADLVARAAAAAAQTTADNAASTANNAQSAANTAQSAAEGAQATANAAIPSAQKGAANGVAGLDVNTKVPLVQTYLEFLYAATTADITNNAANLKDGALIFLVAANT